jgi:predicted DNA-binding transcriptional regulator YafY
MGAGSLDMLAIYLAMIGFDFEVREPVELVKHIRSLAERLVRAASG